MANMLNFLDRVLPPDGDGQRCWVAIRDKRVGQGFCDTNAQLEVLLRGIDSRQWNAFFACSTFKDGSSRAAENVKSVKAFWFDIDAGKGKPYATAEVALHSLHAFCAGIGLGLPLVVCSGNGLHAYWILGEPIAGDQWLPVAKKLKELTKLHGFDADPSRTADRASILRPVETLNWKDLTAPKEVYILEEGEEINFEEFKRIILKENKPLIKDNSLGAAIVGGLGSVGSVRPDMNRGYVDGEGRTHELTKRAGWCLGPDRMTEEQAIEVCLQWNELNTPPIDTEKVIKTVQSLARREAEKKNAVQLPPEIAGDTKLPALPDPFRYGMDNSIMFEMKDPDSEPGENKFKYLPVSKYPFYIESLREEETNGVAGNQSVKITRRTPHTPWKSFTVPRKTLLTSEWQSALGAFGVVCEPGADKALKLLIHKMIQQKEDSGMTDTSYKSFGWKKDRTGFAAGRRYYEKGKVTDISGTAEFEKAADLLTPKPRGSINKWRAAAARVFVAGCEAQALAMLASVAAPLMDLLYADDEGGAIMSLISSKTGQGKTAAILAAETVWGQTNCLRLTEMASDAARFRAIGIRCNMPVVIDEWGNTDIDKIRDRVAIFTGGLDKNRLAMGGEDIRQQLHWKTVMIGTTNQPIVDQLNAANYSAQAARIFEIPVNIPEHLSNTQTSDLNQELQDNAGFAGPVFMAYLLNNFDLDVLKVRVNNLAKEFGLKVNATTEERFKTRMMAGIAVAAAILSSPMINGEPMVEFTPSIIINFGLKVIKDGKHIYAGKKDYIEHLMDFIKDNQHNFVVVDGPYYATKRYTEFDAVLPRQKLMGRYEQQDKKLYIPHDTMHKFAVSVRVPYTEFSKELTKAGIVLNRNRRTQLTAGAVKLTPVTVSCWEIDLSHHAIEGLEGELEDKLAEKRARKLKRDEAKNRVDDDGDMV